MGKNTNTSKCREVVYGCNIRTDRFICNDGFKLEFNVTTIGFLPSKDDVLKLGSVLRNILSSYCDKLIVAHSDSDLSGQLELEY